MGPVELFIFEDENGEHVKVYVFPPSRGRGQEWLARTGGGRMTGAAWSVYHKTREGVIALAKKAARIPALR